MKSIFTQEYRDVIDQLIEARLKADLNQNQIARKLAKSQSFVSKYECCDRRLDIVEFVRICRIVDIDPCRVIRRMGLNRPTRSTK